MQFNTLSRHPVISAVVSAAVSLPMIFALYFMLEPAVVTGQAGTGPHVFTVSQEITGELSFSVAPDDVTLLPSIQGLTGGTGSGTVTFGINTNDPDGYRVTIEFDDAASDVMQQVNGTGTIPNYGGSVTEDFEEEVGDNQAAFAFTVEGPRAATTFRRSGTSCNESEGTADATTCWWLGNTSGGTDIVNGSGTANDEQHTLHFRVHVNENPSPALEEGFYRATATITAIPGTS